MTTPAYMITQLGQFNAYMESRSQLGPAAAGAAGLKASITNALALQLGHGPHIAINDAQLLLTAINTSALEDGQKQRLQQVLEQKMLHVPNPAPMSVHDKQSWKNQCDHLRYFTAADWETFKVPGPGNTPGKNGVLVKRLTAGNFIKPCEKTLADLVATLWCAAAVDGEDMPCPHTLKQHYNELKELFNKARMDLKPEGLQSGMPLPMLQTWPVSPSDLPQGHFQVMYGAEHPVSVEMVAWSSFRKLCSCRNTNKQIRPTEKPNMISSPSDVARIMMQCAAQLGFGPQPSTPAGFRILSPQQNPPPQPLHRQLEDITTMHGARSGAASGSANGLLALTAGPSAVDPLPAHDSPPADGPPPPTVHAAPSGPLAITSGPAAGYVHAGPASGPLAITSGPAAGSPPPGGPMGQLQEFQPAPSATPQMTVEEMERQHKALNDRVAAGALYTYCPHF